MSNEELKASALGALFAAYPAGKDENAADLAMVYNMAIDELPGWAVQRAVKAFIQAKVKGHNAVFRPRTGELSQEVGNQVFLECERQNAQIVNEQKHLKADGQPAPWRHRRNELVSADTVDPGKPVAIPHEDFALMLEHRVDPAMQAKLAKVIPFNTNTHKEAG